MSYINILRFFDNFRFKRLFLPLTLQIIIYIIYGVWLFILVKSVAPNLNLSIPYLSFIWVVSWLAAYLVIFLPGGIGLREGLLVTFLLSSNLDVPSAMTISILIRLYITTSYIYLLPFFIFL